MLLLWFQKPNRLVILSPELYSGPNNVSYFNHYPGSTWHAWDAQLIFLLWGILSRPWLVLLVLLAVMQWFKRRTVRRLSVRLKQLYSPV